MGSRPIGRAWALALALGVILAFHSLPARADGDPASDVLLGQRVFYPYNPPVSVGLQRTLNAEAATAARARFPIKVALIRSPLDLGAVQSLYGRPQAYADFLEQELSLARKQPLLVVMPDGYGVEDLENVGAAAVTSLARPHGSQSDDLARAAIGAIQALAVAAGHRIGPLSSRSARSFTAVALSESALTLVAVAAVLIALGIRGRSLAVASRRGETPATAGVPGSMTSLRTGAHAGTVQPLLVAGSALVFAGAAWALARGLHFYGLTPAGVGYDLDQPPLLLALAGAWLGRRSGRR